MRDWKQVAVDADIDIFFCDPSALAAGHLREHYECGGGPTGLSGRLVPAA